MSGFHQTHLMSMVIVLVLMFSPTSVLGTAVEQTTDYQSSGLVILQPLPNPELTTEPSVVTNGTSSEFSYTHSFSDGGCIEVFRSSIMTYLVNDGSHLFILIENERLLKTLAINFYAHACERTNVCSKVRIFDLQETITDLDGVAYWKEDRE